MEAFWKQSERDLIAVRSVQNFLSEGFDPIGESIRRRVMLYIIIFGMYNRLGDINEKLSDQR